MRLRVRPRTPLPAQISIAGKLISAIRKSISSWRDLVDGITDAPELNHILWESFDTVIEDRAKQSVITDKELIERGCINIIE